MPAAGSAAPPAAALLKASPAPAGAAQTSTAQALEQMLVSFAARDEAAVDMAARYVLHTGVSHLEVAQRLLDELERMRRSGAGLLATSDAELRARRVLSRLGFPQRRCGRSVLLFSDKSDVLAVAFQLVVHVGDGHVSIAVTPDPAQVFALAAEQAWDEVVIDHVTLRRSARRAREFLAPLLEGEARPHVVVTTAAFDDVERDDRSTTWVARDLRQMVTACGIFPRDPLTQREREVLRAVAEGRSNEQIGRQLQLSLSTVKTYLERIHAKLGSVDRASAVAVAIRGGWI